MTVNMARMNAAVDRLPIVLKGPADALDKVRHLIYDAKVDEVDLKLRAELIGRILVGLDQQRQSANDSDDQSHWGAWAVAEDEHRIAVEPELQELDHVLTRMVLWRELQAQEWKPERIAGWRIRHHLDTSALRVNKAEDWRQLYDRGGIGPAGLRRVSGADETDAPTPVEIVRSFGWKANDPYLAFYGLDGITVDWDKVGKLRGSARGPQADSPAEDAPTGPGSGDPGSPNDRDDDAPESDTPDA
jgi:hypothetical protein